MAVSDAKRIIDTLSPKEKRGATYANGTVMSVKGNVAYVNIEGGAQQTPCQLAMSAKVGDKVKISIIDHTASITGNYTTPATGDAEAIAARRKADAAFDSAMEAYGSAQTAAAAATAASASAGRAAAAAETAGEKATAAEGYANTALTEAQKATTAAETAQGMAKTASDKADEASASAYNANEYAARALGHLGTVESVTETLAWITEHGTMELTQDTVPDPTHVYFVASENGYYQVGTKQAYRLTEDVAIDPDKDYYKLVYSYTLTTDTDIVEGKTYYQLVEGEYVVVENPVVEDISTYYERSESYELVQNPVVEDISTYYEIVDVPARYDIVVEPDPTKMGEYYELSVRKSLQNYVGSHLSQTNYGLNLLVDGTNSRIHIGTVDGEHPIGTYIIDDSGDIVGNFTSEKTMIGSKSDIHVEIKGSRMSFLAAGYSLPDDMTGHDPTEPFPGEIAFLAVDPSTNQSMFYMNRSVVVNDLYFGKWQWRSRANDNMTLTWVGESND